MTAVHRICHWIAARFRKTQRNNGQNEGYPPKPIKEPVQEGDSLHGKILMGLYRQRKQAYGADHVFSWLYDHLAKSADGAQIGYIGREAMQYLLTIDPLHGSRLRSQCYPEWSSCEPSVWKNHCTEEEYRALLCLGTLHENGYLREKCLRLIRNDVQALPYILLRVNDWVPRIRKIAISSLPQLIADGEPGQLMDAMPYFHRLFDSGRCQQDYQHRLRELCSMMANRFAEQPEQIFCKPVRVRRLCYQTIFLKCQDHHCTQVQKTLIRCWMNGERDGAQRNWLVTLYLQECGEEIPPQELAAFQHDKCWRIRYQAYVRRLRKEGIWDGFEALLLDKARSIRELAAYWLEQSGFDCAAYCRSHCPDGIPALGETGTKADILYIRQFLADYPCECLPALVRLEAEDAEALLWEQLHSESPAAARTAFRLARAHHVRLPVDGMLAELQATTNPKFRWRLVKLLGTSGDWRVLPVLIRLVEEDSHLRMDILHAIENRSPWQQLSPELAAEIGRALDGAGSCIPEQMVRLLRFDLHRLTVSSQKAQSAGKM